MTTNRTRTARWLVLALLGGVAAAQIPDPALAKGRVMEEAEHDLDAAARLYQEAAENDSATTAVRAEAFLRLGRVRQRMGDYEAARAAFGSAMGLGGDAAEPAKRMLDLLQDPQRADGATDLEILRLMTVVREQQGAGAADEALDQLAWFGDRAVPLLAEAVRTEKDFGFVTYCARGLLKIGGPKVEAWIADATKFDDALRRRAVARAADAVRARIDRRQLAAFLGDPSAEVRLQAVESGVVVDWVQALAMLRDEDARVREATVVWFGVNDQRNRSVGSTELPEPARQREVIGELLDVLEERCADAALIVDAVRRVSTGIQLTADPVDRAALFLRLARARGLRGSLSSIGVNVGQVGSPNVLVDEVLAAAQALKDVDPSGAEGWRLEMFTKVRNVLVDSSWDRASLGAVLELARLGFAPAAGWFPRHATGEDWVVVFGELELLAGAYGDDVRQMLRRTLDDELPESAFEPLRGAFESWIAQGTSWGLINEAAIRLGMFDSPGALGWCERMVVRDLAASARGRSDPSTAEKVRSAMLSGVFTKDDPARRAMVRRLAVAEGDGLEELRNQALARIAWVHDVEATPLFARAYELGITASNAIEPFGWSLNASTTCGSGWLERPMLFRARFGRHDTEQSQPWSEEEYAAVVEPCLATGLEMPWREFRTDRPVAVAEAVLRQFDRCPSVGVRKNLLQFFAGSRGPQAPIVPPGLRRAFILRGLRDGDVEVRRSTGQLLVQAYEEIANDELEAAVLRAVGDPDSQVARQAIYLLGRRRDARFWDPIVARLDDPENAPTAMAALLSIDQSRALDVILPRLGAPSLRSWTCSFAKQTIDRRFVPLLVDALRDGREDVRKSAREALEAIEFYVSQEARWKRLLGDAGLDAPSAAEALLKQARDAEQPRIRLAAIASLGTLAVPETLPFLIQLMQDPDPAIASAAAAAVERINK